MTRKSRTNQKPTKVRKKEVSRKEAMAIRREKQLNYKALPIKDDSKYTVEALQKIRRQERNFFGEPRR